MSGRNRQKRMMTQEEQQKADERYMRMAYVAADEKRGYRAFAPHVLHPRTTVTGGILEEVCRQLMQDFFRDRR